jgi:hypothetical protein
VTGQAAAPGLVTYHVHPVGELWKVGIAGDGHPASMHLNKSEAIDTARRLARAHGRAEVVVHASDGSVETAFRHEQALPRRVG